MAAIFGKKLKKNSFYLDDEFVYVNHGSFGTVPKPVYEKRLQLLQEVESNPDTWFKYKYLTLVQNELQVAADLINCKKDEVVFVENATSGMTVALQSLNIQPNEGLLVSTLSYEAVRFTADRTCIRELKMNYHVIDLDPPLNDKEEIIERYRSYLSSHDNVKVAIVDHITSPTSIVLPVKEIVEVCHSFGVKVIIDGAHAPGQLKIDVTDIGAEFYTGNLHKWYFCPRGCCILYIRPDQRDIVKPLLASSLYMKGYPDEFYVQGTRDSTPYCTVSEAKRFYESLGGISEVTKYCSSLIDWAANMLSLKLKQPQLSVPRDMRSPFMACIRLPDQLQGDVYHLVKALADKYNIISFVGIAMNESWLRISAGVYNSREDYEKLADALLDLMNKSTK